MECIPELNICKKMIAVPIKIDEYEILVRERERDKCFYLQKLSGL